MVGKGGWIKIVEAFISIMLIIAVLLIVINKGYVGKEDISGKVYDAQISILREIELDKELRNNILSADISSGSVQLPIIQNKIDERSPNYLDCESRICPMNSICALDVFVDQNVYAQSIAITANLTTYLPRQLKLFCWVK